jgi:hypothetical protein
VDAAVAIRRIAPDGVDLVVEVAPGANARLNEQVLATDGTVAVYANNGGAQVTPRPACCRGDGDLEPFRGTPQWPLLLDDTPGQSQSAGL